MTFYLNMKEKNTAGFPVFFVRGNNNFPARRDRSISCNLTEVDCYYTYRKPGLSTCIRLVMLVSRRTFSFRIFLLLFGDDFRACGTYNNMYVINNIYDELGFSGGIVTSHMTYTLFVAVQ